MCVLSGILVDDGIVDISDVCAMSDKDPYVLHQENSVSSASSHGENAIIFSEAW